MYVTIRRCELMYRAVRMWPSLDRSGNGDFILDIGRVRIRVNVSLRRWRSWA